MRKRELRRIGFFMLLYILTLTPCLCDTIQMWENKKNGYSAKVQACPDDELDIEQQKTLLSLLEPLTQKTNAAIKVASADWLRANPDWEETAVETLIDGDGLLICWLDDGTGTLREYSWFSGPEELKQYEQKAVFAVTDGKVLTEEELAGILEANGQKVNYQDLANETEKIISEIMQIWEDRINRSISWVIPAGLALLTSLLINLFLVKRTRRMAADPVDILNRKDGRKIRWSDWSMAQGRQASFLDDF